jgi:hypothetical protein
LYALLLKPLMPLLLLLHALLLQPWRAALLLLLLLRAHAYCAVAAAGELCCLFGVPVRGGLFLAYDSYEAWRVCAVQGRG